VARLDRHVHADDDGFLADIEVTESADQTHPVELPRLLLEPADEQHGAIGPKLLLLVEIRHVGRMFHGCSTHCGRLGRWFVAGNGHWSPRGWAIGRRGGGSPIAEIPTGRKRTGISRARPFAPADRQAGRLSQTAVEPSRASGLLE